jgi:hypothetical protein
MSDANPQATNKSDVWTIMLYMAGDNNLSEECVYALTEIKTALPDTPSRLRVIAQFDPSGVRTETKRYELRSQAKYTLDDDAEKTGWKAHETNTGEPQNLLEFVRWGISQYKADNYMVILVGHGSGTEEDFLVRDENPANSLSILELQDVFTKLTQDGHTIAILGMDTCLMSMAEVCYELLRTNVTYLVGSEGFSPNTGWPYAAILKKLADKIPSGKATPEWLAKVIVDEQKNFYIPYINGGISVDQAVLEVAKIDEVQRKMFLLVRGLVEEIEKGELDYFKPKQNAMLLAHWEAQSYNGEAFVDLFDFCDRLRQRYTTYSENAQVIGLCKDVMDAVRGVVVKSAVAGAAFQFSYGLSIYFPWAVLTPAYANLSFPKATNWIDFLRLYHKVTKRAGRAVQDNSSGRAGKIGSTAQAFPFRASVPTNKGRDGRIDSMRNAPDEEFITPDDAVVSTNGHRPTSQLPDKPEEKVRPKLKAKRAVR